MIHKKNQIHYFIRECCLFSNDLVVNIYRIYCFLSNSFCVSLQLTRQQQSPLRRVRNKSDPSEECDPDQQQQLREDRRWMREVSPLGVQVWHQGELADRRFFADETPGLEHGRVRMRDPLFISTALQSETFLCHASHQAGGFLEASSHGFKAGAICGESCFSPGEVSHEISRSDVATGPEPPDLP